MKILAIETSCDDTGIAILDIKEDKTPEFFVLANKIASQIKVHQKYGGVFPMMAKREHQRNLLPTFKKSLEDSKLLKISKSKFLISNQIQSQKIQKVKEILNREPELAEKIIPFLKKYSKPDIDYIAVTNGPGLEPCLWVGVNFARAISYFWDIPLIPINHIEGHILVNFLPAHAVIPTKVGIQSNVQKPWIQGQARNDNDIKFPAIALVVSGGHTQLVLINKIGDYKILGETRDDAAGECFDKAAKILGLGYPGGPIISELADRHPMSIQSRRHRVSTRLPRPMINTKDYDFSFSGLKTAILYKVKKDCGYAPLRSAFGRTTEGRQYIKQMSVEIQQVIIDVLLKKTFKAIKDFNAKTIILGGGVSANSELKKQFQKACNSYNKDSSASSRGGSQTDEAVQSKHANPRLPRSPLGLARNDSELNLIFPEPVLSTDNGLMIAVAGYLTLLRQGYEGQAKKTTTWQELKADSNLRIGE